MRRISFRNLSHDETTTDTVRKTSRQDNAARQLSIDPMKIFSKPMKGTTAMLVSTLVSHCTAVLGPTHKEMVDQCTARYHRSLSDSNGERQLISVCSGNIVLTSFRFVLRGIFRWHCLLAAHSAGCRSRHRLSEKLLSQCRSRRYGSEANW